MNGKFHVRTWHAFLFTLGLILFGFVWNTYYPDSQLKLYSGTVEVLFFGYALKRTVQKHKVLGGNNEEDCDPPAGGSVGGGGGVLPDKK